MCYAMNFNTLISIVMSACNDADHVPITTESVLCQTEKDFEFIIVNDGSADERVESILEDYASRDPRIRIIHKTNEGLTRALIDGCAVAKGEYIARIDVGDVMLPERLAKQKAVLDKHQDVVLVSCWTECCGPEWEYLYTTKEKTFGTKEGSEWIANVISDQDHDDLIEGPSHHGSVMFRADAYRDVGGYRAEFYYGQDWDLWYRLAEVGKFAGVQDVLYRCRIFPDGISMGNVKRQRAIHACSRGAFLARWRGEDETPFLEKAFEIRPKPAAGKKQKSIAKRSAGYYFIGETLRKNRDPRCRGYLLNAIAIQPWNIKTWVRLVQSLFLRSMH